MNPKKILLNLVTRSTAPIIKALAREITAQLQAAQTAPKPARTETAQKNSTRTEPVRTDSALKPAQKSRRTDAQILELYGPAMRTAHAQKPLTRYRVEQITGAGGRQAARILTAITGDKNAVAHPVQRRAAEIQSTYEANARAL